MNQNKFPDTVTQLPPDGEDVRVTILTPEEADAQPTAAQEIGVVDGEFQVYHNPAEDAEGYMETGWTVQDALNKRNEDGSKMPVVVLWKRTESPDGASAVIEEKTVPREVFESWQQPKDPDTEGSAAPVGVSQGSESTTFAAEADSLPVLTTIEDLGETAVDESGEVVLVTSAEPTTEVTETPEDLTEVDENVDLRALFADGFSLENAMHNPAIAVETRGELIALAEQWKSTMGIVAAIGRVWEEDLQPVVLKVAQESAHSMSDMQIFVTQVDHIMSKMDRIGTAQRDTSTEGEQAILQELEQDDSFAILDKALERYANPTELLPSAQALKKGEMVAFEKVTHAEQSTEMSEKDYDDLALYAQPMIAKGVPLSVIQNSIAENNGGKIQEWVKTITLIEAANAATGLVSNNNVGESISNFVNLLQRWRGDVREIGAHTLILSVLDLAEQLHHTRGNLYNASAEVELALVAKL